MSFLDDVLSVIATPVNAAGDAVTSFVEAVPGGKWVEGAYNQGATWLGEMARDPAGQWALTVIAGGLSQVAAPIFGPMLASIVWSFPGYLRGECLGGSYVREMVERVTLLLEKFGLEVIPHGYLGQVDSLLHGNTKSDPEGLTLVDLVNRNTIDTMKAAALKGGGAAIDTSRALDDLNLSPRVLAKRFHVREDSIATAMKTILCENVYDISKFDPTTGAEPRPPPGVVDPNRPAPTGGPLPMGGGAVLFLVPDPLPPGSSSTDILLAILDYEQKGVPEDNLAKLKQQYVDVLKVEIASGAGIGTPQHVPAGQIAVSLGPPLAVQIGAPTDLGKRIASLAILTAPAWGMLLYVHLRGGGRS